MNATKMAASKPHNVPLVVKSPVEQPMSIMPVKLYAIGATLPLGWTLSWMWRVLIGYYYLFTYYIRAASDTSLLNEVCRRVYLEPSPFRNLSNADWFSLQRCRGIRWGFDRYGDVFPSLKETVGYLSVGIYFPSLLVSQDTISDLFERMLIGTVYRVSLSFCI